MFYTSTSDVIYQAHTKELAELVSANIEEFGSSEMNIDFGGIFVRGMESIRLTANGRVYSLLAHHLPMLLSALAASKADEFVVVHTLRFSHLLTREDADEIVRVVNEQSVQYEALVVYNNECYKRAIAALAGHPGIDVSRELKNITPSEIV
jgi:hypothetical protein